MPLVIVVCALGQLNQRHASHKLPSLESKNFIWRADRLQLEVCQGSLGHSIGFDCPSKGTPQWQD